MQSLAWLPGGPLKLLVGDYSDPRVIYRQQDPVAGGLGNALPNRAQLILTQFGSYRVGVQAPPADTLLTLT